ncbi:MAG: PD-(D/E)XK nuclease family protein, partial [Oscillospiraceae bacterium]
ERAVKLVAERLTVYRRPSQKPTFLSGLLTTLDECKSYCVPYQSLVETGQETGGIAGDKLCDLGLIFGAYEALCARTALDPRDKLTRLADALKTCSWADDLDIYVDGFTDFTPQEQGVLGALLSRCHSVTVALTCDAPEGDGEGVFAPAQRSIAALRHLAQKAGTEITVAFPPQREDTKAPPLQFLEAHLMDDSGAVFAEKTDRVARYRATSPWNEVEWAAAQILSLVREGGYRFRDIAVAARRFEGYDELVETIFPRYGIPVFAAQTSDILEKPILTLITAALDCAFGGFSYDDVFRYLKTGLTDLSDNDRDLLENYVLKWDIKGAKWTAKADWTLHPRGYGLEFTPEDEALLKKLDALRRQVVAPLEKLRKNSDKTGRGHAMALYAFLEEIHLPGRLQQRTAGLTALGKLGLAEEYAQLWDIVRGGLEQCALLLSDTVMEPEEFAKLFTLVLSQYEVGTIPVSLDRVTAGECTRLGYQTVKVLLLLGCDDNAMPLCTPSPGLFTDDDRILLSDYGLELAPVLGDKLQRELTITYTAAATPTQRLLLSYSAADAAGGEQRPAFLYERVCALFPAVGETNPAEDFRYAAPRAALELAGFHPAVRSALLKLPDFSEKIARMDRGLKGERGSLSAKTVRALYGEKVPMSASRMDLYKSCHFSYFMRYGLKAQPRQSAGFEAPEYGTFVHYVMEHVLQDERVKDSKGDVPKALLQTLVGETVNRYIDEELGGLEDKTPRFQYLFRRLLTSVEGVAENVVLELSHSEFPPLAFELGFGRTGTLPAVECTEQGLTVSISGFVDRVDGWEHEGKLYLRVVDYKTGKKSFDLTEIWNGLGQQMLLYLYTLAEQGKGLFSLPPVPAGVLYLPARDTIVAGSRDMTEEERQKKEDAELQRKGIVLSDPLVLEAMEKPEETGPRFLPVKRSAKTGEFTGDALVSAEQLALLRRHLQVTLKEIAGELAGGTIAADPYWRGPQQNACQWCEFAAACQFEEGRGDCKRWLPTVSGPEFWENLK